jgi:hypothetical protein
LPQHAAMRASCKQKAGTTGRPSKSRRGLSGAASNSTPPGRPSRTGSSSRP